MKRRFTAPAIAAICVVAAVVLAVIIGAVGSSQGACVSCHGDYAKAQVGTSHASTSCVACHAAGAAERVGIAGRVIAEMIPARLAGRELGGPVMETTRQSCLACHARVVRAVSSGSSAVRINHATCAQGASCDSCHSTIGHGKLTRWKRDPAMEDCTRCHSQKGASLKCDTCHTGGKARQRLAVVPWQVTHGSNWRQTHGMGQLDSCVTCHPANYCVQCHKVTIPHDSSFGSQHGALAVADRSACLTCHKTESFCDACHGIAMPHPADFAKTHSSVAKKFDDPICQRCHSRQTCDGCHTAHIHPGFDAFGNGTGVSPTPGRP